MKNIIKLAFLAIILISLASCAASRGTGYKNGSKKSCGCKGMVGY